MFGISSTQLAEKMGVQRSSISHILSGRNKPSFDFIVKLMEQFPELNADWVLLGKGNMLKSTLNTPKKEQEGSLFTNMGDVTHKAPIKEGFKRHNEETVKQVNSPLTKKISSVPEPSTPEVTNVNKVKYIVFVYEDDSFKILNKQ